MHDRQITKIIEKFQYIKKTELIEIIPVMIGILCRSLLWNMGISAPLRKMRDVWFT